MSSVTVLCPNARRCSVKVTPGMLMRQVLEEACLKNGFDADVFQLSNQKRYVDLSLPFRLSGLPNNATLEMVESSRTTPDQKVTIALQTETGSRMECEFAVSTTLFEMLEFFSRQSGEDLTALGSTTAPSCSYMNRQYSGPVELQRTTLSSIGISSGKCLLRYQRIPLTKQQLDDIAARIAAEDAGKQALLTDYAKKKAENEERARIEAARLARFEEELRLGKLQEKVTHSKEEQESMDTNIEHEQRVFPTAVRDRLRSPPRNHDGWSFDNPIFRTPSAAETPTRENRLANLNRLLQQVDTSLNTPHSDHDRLTDILAEGGRIPLSRIAVEAIRLDEHDLPTAGSVPPTAVPPCERRPVIFHRGTKLEGDKDLELSDDFFEVGVDDVKARQRQLREEVRRSAQRAFVPTKYVKEKNRERKLLAYRNVVIRMPVDSEKMLQAQFVSAEPISRLFEFIRSVIVRNIPFSLKLPLNISLEESDLKNFVDADLAPKSTVLVRFKDSSSLESVLMVSAFQQCSQDEAEKLSREWLSHNTVFEPYTPLVEEEERPSKRPGSTLSAVGPEFAAPPRKVNEVPKWLRKK